MASCIACNKASVESLAKGISMAWRGAFHADTSDGYTDHNTRACTSHNTDGCTNTDGCANNNTDGCANTNTKA